MDTCWNKIERREGSAPVNRADADKQNPKSEFSGCSLKVEGVQMENFKLAPLAESHQDPDWWLLIKLCSRRRQRWIMIGVKRHHG